MRKRVNPILVIIPTILAIAVAAAWFASASQLAQVRQVAEGQAISLEIGSKESEAMRRLIEFDALVIAEGEYGIAFEGYRALQKEGSTVIRDALAQRIMALEPLLAGNNDQRDGDDPRNMLLQQYQRNIQDLERRTAYLENARQRSMDSMRSRIEDLSAEMERKEKEIGKKESVQVITFNSSKGGKIHYLGEVVSGKANGGGVGIWTTGSVYRGQWRNNLRHGQGTFEWADGERYEGTYVDGIREGFGKYHWPSGDRYEGQWKGDRRNGQGTLFDMDGNIRYKGNWKDDKPVDRAAGSQAP